MGAVIAVTVDGVIDGFERMTFMRCPNCKHLLGSLGLYRVGEDDCLFCGERIDVLMVSEVMVPKEFGGIFHTRDG